MQTYSVLIAWNDNDDEEGEFGWTGRASDTNEAEKKAREAMRASYRDDYGDECADLREGDEGEVFGGRVIDLQVGAMWRAGDLEVALRGLLAQVDDMAARCGWADRGERAAARKLIDELDNGEG